MSTRNKLADRTTGPYERSRRDGDEPQGRTRTPRKVEISSRDGQKKTRTPNAKNGDKYHNLFGRTSTLTGAFASTGPALGGNHGNEIGSREVKTGKTPPKQNNYREGNIPAVSPGSNASSPRHRDFLGTYRRFSDGDDMGFDDDPYTMAPDPLSPSPSSRQRYTATGRYVPNPTLDFYDITEPPRRRSRSQHASDQERLRRATERGPVLSKAIVGNKRRTSTERVPVQKEEPEAEEIQLKPRFEPSLNVPSSWGQKSKLAKGIIERMNREDVGDVFEDEPVQASAEWENDLDFTSRSFQVSDSPPLQTPRTSNSPPTFRTKISPRMLDRRRNLPEEQIQASHSPKRSPILDTPVPAHNEAGNDRPRFSKRDNSEELLRKLRRSESPSVSNTPEPKHVDDTISNMKTPVVTGAWIDTPAPERTTAPEPVNAKEQPSPIAESVEEPDAIQPHKSEESKPVADKPPPERTKPKVRTVRRPRPELKKPNLPKSGLEAIIEEAKSGRDKSLLVGENTIDSLQELLLDDNPDFSEFKGFDPKDLKPSDSDKTSSDEDDLALPPGAPNEAVIDRMNAKLQSLVRNIKEVRDGLSGLETQANKDVASLSPLSKKRGKKSHLCRGKGEPCEACGLSGDGRLYLALPVPRFWYRRPDTNRLRPTFLGWFVISVIVWWFLECLMCELYCEPLYLDTSRPFPLPDPDAPETPFVIPTMLWRWSGLEPVLAPVWTVLVAFYRFWAQLFGFWDSQKPPEIPIYLRGGPLMDDVTASQMLARNGYVGRPDSPVDFGRPPLKYTPPRERQPPPSRHAYWGQDDADEGLSMDEDEIL